MRITIVLVLCVGLVVDRNGIVQAHTVGGSALPQSYSVTDLGTLGGTSVGVRGINNAGDVIGFSNPVGDLTTRAYIYSSGVMTDLGTLPGGGISFGNGINEAGQATGWATSIDTSTRAFRYENGLMSDLGTLGGYTSYGNGINAQGLTTGQADTLPSYSDPQYHAFVHDGSAMIDIGTLGGQYSAGMGINDVGSVAGWSTTSGSATHAFVYSGGQMTDIGTLPGGGYSIASAISHSGQVTGEADTAGGTEVHAFLFSNGLLSDLGTLGGTISTGHGINSAGQVVGESFTAGNATVHGFIYSDGVMTDLNSLIPPSSGWSIAAAWAINDSGQIAALANYNGGEGRAVLLNPVSTTYAARVEQPINADGSSVFNASRGTIPIKYSLTLNGVPTCELPPAQIALTRVTGPAAALVLDDFRVLNCHYSYNLKASSLGPGTYRIDISLMGTGPVGSSSFILR